MPVIRNAARPRRTAGIVEAEEVWDAKIGRAPPANVPRQPQTRVRLVHAFQENAQRVDHAALRAMDRRYQRDGVTFYKNFAVGVLVALLYVCITYYVVFPG